MRMAYKHEIRLLIRVINLLLQNKSSRRRSMASRRINCIKSMNNKSISRIIRKSNIIRRLVSMKSNNRASRRSNNIRSTFIMIISRAGVAGAWI